MGRFLCNTLQEAFDSAAQTVAGRKRDFDVIVIGGGTFGAVVAEHLFVADATRSRRILVLEAGPFVLPEHVQNMPFQGGAPDLRVPWINHPALNYSGLIFAIGGRSLTWGGWSPELLDVELTAWPPSTRAALRPPANPATGYFAQASRQIGVKETNDFIYGPLHTALRKQLHAALKAVGNMTGFTFADLLEHPAVRYPDTGEPPIDAKLLRDWLGLPATDTTPESELHELFKLEAPLAVQSTTLPGLFPTNKFSAVPGLIRAARIGSSEADGVGAAVDARKRLMIVPDCHVQELITQTEPDNWVRVTGVRVWQNGTSVDIALAPQRNGGQSAAVIALGTVETTRVALTTFQQSLAGRAAQRMGTNLIAHLRSNLTIRVPKKSVEANLPPPTALTSLQCSALLVKGKAANGRTFHFQITASGLNELGVDSEAELFKKIPTLEHLEAMLRASDKTVVITIRGIGDMTPHNAESFIDLSTLETDFNRPKAVVHLSNAKATPQEFPGSAETKNDRKTWDEMDAVSNKIALIFAGDEPFEILPDAANAIPVPAGTMAQRLAALAAFKKRRDDLGTTHHDAGTMRMGDNVADAVTNDFGRIHDTTNCYIAGPALFPTVGSPNPMLTGVALGRRTADLLQGSVLAGPDPVVSPQSDAGFRALFDGTDATFKKWRLAGLAGGGMLHLNGELVSYGDGGLRLFYYAAEQFGDFTLRLQFRISDTANHNSGVFVRFPRPTLGLSDALKLRAPNEPSFDPGNAAWKPVISGFEVQIDDNARGDSRKDFYGINPEPDGLFKNRTGAIYKIQAGDRVWHLNFNEPTAQNYTPGPPLVPDVWFEYEIAVQGDNYAVFLTNTQAGTRQQTTSFHNPDPDRGRAPGFVGVQAYAGNTVAWRHIRIKTP
ncbi:MAG: hypothetical protein QOC70_2678 [Verrucomicrobiota bacterium]